MIDLATIKTLGRLLDDLERVRIMNGNRIGALQRETGDPLPHLIVIQANLAAVEHQAELELIRAWRKHPLAPWAKGVKGVGEKTIARLVCEIGDPAERPNVAKLWAYCGYGDPKRKRVRNMTQEEAFKLGNPSAKKRCFLVAEAMVKNRESAYRQVYDQARDTYADRVHADVCVRCGPAGKPAAQGSPWSLGHQHAAALRKVSQRFLLDLWVEARRQQGLSVTPKRGTRGGQQRRHLRAA